MEGSPDRFPEQRRAVPTVESTSLPALDTLFSLTRLVIGGALLGVDELSRRLPEWEGHAAQLADDRERPIARMDPGEQAPPPGPPAPRSGETSYALLGVLFRSETYVRRGVATLGRMERAAWRLASPVHKPLRAWRIFGPGRRRYENLVERGETTVNRWVELGHAEAQRSRDLVQTAVEDTVDESITYVAESPEVRDLLTQTGTSLAGDVGDEVRARTVSSDALLEAVARRLFRRRPREYPPEPPITAAMLQSGQTKGD